MVVLCTSGFGHKATFSAIENGDQQMNEGRRVGSVNLLSHFLSSVDTDQTQQARTAPSPDVSIEDQMLPIRHSCVRPC
jgi:hypothetical protein